MSPVPALAGAGTGYAPATAGQPNFAKQLLQVFDQEFAAPDYPFAPLGLLALEVDATDYLRAPVVSALDMYRRGLLSMGANASARLGTSGINVLSIVGVGPFSADADDVNGDLVPKMAYVSCPNVSHNAWLLNFDNVWNPTADHVIFSTTLDAFPRNTDFAGRLPGASLPFGINIESCKAPVKVVASEQGGVSIMALPQRVASDIAPSPIESHRIADVRARTLDALSYISNMLVVSDRRVALALGISPSSFSNWNAGRMPRPSRAARVLALQSLLRAVERRMGSANAIEWFEGGAPVSRRDRILSGQIDDVQREVYAFVFTMPPAPQDGYAPAPKVAQPKRRREALALTNTKPTKVTIDGRDR